MDFDKMLSHRIEMIEVPDELSPENMAKMLKALPPRTQPAYTTAVRTPVTLRSNVSRNVVMRSISAAAAFAALAAGFVAYTDKSSEPAQLESEIVYKALEQPRSYDDLFDIYTQIYLSGGTAETVYDEDDEEADTGSDSAYDINSESDVLPQKGSAENTVRAENGTVYYLKGGNICSISENGIRLCADVSSKKPIEMYVDSDRLILVSENIQPSGGTDENDPYGYGAVRTDAEADIYDIGSGNAEFIGSFTQSGRYISSRVSDGKLYMVTCYSDYRMNPLGEETDLDNYVPYYFLGGVKNYVAASDIIVPANAASTDYTVVSAVNAGDFGADGGNAADGSVSVKALLGSSRRIYCSDNTLYTAGVGKGEGNTDYTALTSFDITEGIEYKASGSVEGIILKHGGFDEYNGALRVVTDSSADGTEYTNIYVLDDSLSVTNSAGKLLPDEDVRSVSFADRYAVLNVRDNAYPGLIVDLASYPPVIADEMMNSGSSVFAAFADGLMTGLGYEEDRGLVLTMFTSDGARLSDIAFADEEGAFSEAFSSRKSLLVDSERGLVGVPVSVKDEFGIHGRYYLFKYTASGGFAETGHIEYSDIDDSCVFRSAVISEDSIYIISDARIVLAQLSDMKVIESFEIS